MSTRAIVIAVVLSAVLLPSAVARGQDQMPDPSAMSGIPRPATDLPAGSVSVRVVRGAFNNLPDEQVEFVIDGSSRVVTTDAEGRAEVSGLPAGARVVASVEVDGQRLVTQEMVVGTAGIRVLLVAADPETAARAEEDRRLAATPAVKGSVVLGPDTRVIAQLAQDRLTLFYVIQIINSARVPVDIGGPLIFDLPAEARGTTILEGSSTQATANGAHVIVAGPFAPGFTNLEVAFELPTGGGTARVVQRWPATLQEITVLATRVGDLDIASDQFADKREVLDRGQPLLVGSGPTVPAGQTLTFEITGLPYHARWPRYLALTLAGTLMLVGLWGAATARPRKAVA